MSTRHGFTLIELLVTISIIGILAGLLLPGLALVRRRQKTLQTEVNLKALSAAMILYLDRHGILGPGGYPEEFDRDPLRYLLRDAGARPFIDPAGRQVLRDTSNAGTGPFVAADLATGTHLIDGWKQPILVRTQQTPVAGASPARYFQERVLLRSTAGTRDPAVKDDLVWELTRGGGEFRPVKMVSVSGGSWVVADP